MTIRLKTYWACEQGLMGQYDIVVLDKCTLVDVYIVLVLVDGHHHDHEILLL